MYFVTDMAFLFVLHNFLTFIVNENKALDDYSNCCQHNACVRYHMQ